MLNLYLLELIARAGGGGSGGGSGGSGGGGAVAAFFFTGYAPMSYIGHRFRLADNKITGSIILYISSLVISILSAVFLSEVFGGWLIPFWAGLFVGPASGLLNWFNFIGKRRERAKQDLQEAVKTDSTWNEQDLVKTTSETFMTFQAGWSKNDLTSCKSLMSPAYFEHARLMIDALVLAGRQNFVVDPVLNKVELIEIVDKDGKDGDMFMMHITAKADDQLTDILSNTLLLQDKKTFQEFWRFVRVNDAWLLDGILQLTASGFSANQDLNFFAKENGLFYSLDWGWLLLPARGQIFGKSKFGKSDINNHVIGLYSSKKTDQALKSQDHLIQIYNYILNPQTATRNYLVAQIYLPKEYGNILVRRKSGIFNKTPKGLEKVELEWADFNDRYEVFATNPELATSFELLNPKYMETIYNLPFEVNIEVVDNVVYLYGHKITPSSENYAALLSALQAAFKEMKR